MGIFITIVFLIVVIYFINKDSSENNYKDSSTASRRNEKFIERDEQVNKDEYEEPDNEMLEVEVYKDLIGGEYENIYDNDGGDSDYGDSGGDE